MTSFGLVSSPTSPSATSVSALAERPNIVFIMSDDHAAHAIRAYGSRVNRTPNIDRLADEMSRAGQDPKFVEQLHTNGIEPAIEGPEKFAAFIAAEIPNWAKAVDIAGVKLEQ